MKHLFIVNPAAGKGKALDYISRIHTFFFEKREEYSIEVTVRPGQAIELVRNYVLKDDYYVYSIGGDGTLNEVLNGLVGSNSTLAVIPGGTGNDFIRSIANFDLNENILERTINGKEEWIDLVKVNGRYFINIASVGLDAEIVHNARLFKNKPFVKGKGAYVLGLVFTLSKYKGKIINISIDDNIFKADTLLIGVANGKYYGGGMKFAPKADLKDGLLEICHVKNISKIRIPFLFPKLIKGTHGAIKEVTFYRGKKIILSCEEELTLNLDGEIQRVKEAKFEILPSSVKIITPL